MSTLERRQGNALILELDSEEERNCLSEETVNSILSASKSAAHDPEVLVFALKGTKSHFCSGFDLKTVEALGENEPKIQKFARDYMSLLESLSTNPKLVVVFAEGDSIGGGVGILAASDLVFMSKTATVSCPELSIGLIPAMVLPFLQRKVGYHNAFKISLALRALTLKEALEIGLVDEEFVSFDEALRQVMMKISRAGDSGVRDLKSYMTKQWPILPEQKELAMQTFIQLLLRKETQSKIRSLLKILSK